MKRNYAKYTLACLLFCGNCMFLYLFSETNKVEYGGSGESYGESHRNAYCSHLHNET